jgi:hypothetical protein
MSEHDWRYLYCHPHNGEYLFECIHCKYTDYISRSDYLAGLKPNPTNSLCLGRIEEAKEETLQVPKCDSNLDIGISFDEFVDALYRAGWRSVCDAQHTELEKLWNKHVETKSGNPWKDAVLNAMKSYNMDIAHYENEPDNAVCDLLYMHANAEAHRAMMDYFSKEGDSKG